MSTTLKIKNKDKELFNKYENIVLAIDQNKPNKKAFTKSESIQICKIISEAVNMTDKFEDGPSSAELAVARQNAVALISKQFSMSFINDINTIRSMSDEVGIVDFKKVISETTRGDVTAGEEILGSSGKINNKLKDFAKDSQTITHTIEAGPDLDFTIQLGKNVRKNSIRISIANRASYSGRDYPTERSTTGNIAGRGFKWHESTIDYITGELKLNLESINGDEAVANDKVMISYSIDIYEEGNTPKLKTVIDSQLIIADYYAIESSYNRVNSAVVKKRLGFGLDESIANDLANGITNAVHLNAIDVIYKAAVANESVSGFTALTWRKERTNVSAIDTRRLFSDAITDAQSGMSKLCGSGAVDFIISGTEGLKVVKSIDGWVPIQDQRPKGVPYLAGYYDNIPFIACPEGTTSLRSQDMIMGNNDMNDDLDIGAIYAPFLPVTNVEGTTRAAEVNQLSFHSAAIEVLVQGKFVRVEIN